MHLEQQDARQEAVSYLKGGLRLRLSELILPYNFYRRLAGLVNWTFLNEETQVLYSHIGQPSLAPMVFFKLLLVSQLENLVSYRRLVERGALRLDIQYFLDYEVNKELHWNSTMSRTGQLFLAAVFVFDHVFAQCAA